MHYFLRTTDAKGKSHGGFQWPFKISAIVTAPDWNPAPHCGNGLHGLLNGEGESSHLSFESSSIWWIVEADSPLDLGGKHKFQTCRIVAFGNRADITSQLRRMTGGAVHGLIETVGDNSTLTGGDNSTLTGGNGSTLTGGYDSTLTGGYDSTLTGGNHSTLTGGRHSTLTGGYGSTLTGGNGSTLTGGHHSTLTGGYNSTLTGGNGSTLTGGYSSTLTGGNGSTLTGGNGSTLTGGYSSTLTGGYRSTLIFLKWIDRRRRVLIAYVGEDGIKPGVAYRANDDHRAIVPA